MKQETFTEIGLAIQKHRNIEMQASKCLAAVSRILCSTESTTGYNGEIQYWILNHPDGNRMPVKTDGKSIFKNSELAKKILYSKDGSFQHTILSPYGNHTRITNEIEGKIFNRADYRPIPNSAEEISIYYPGERKSHKFQHLSDLIKEVQKQSEELERIKRQQEEAEAKRRAAEELARSKELEEAKRIAAEKEIEEAKEREKKAKEEIERLEREIVESNAKIQERKTFIRKGNSLRSQHILDEAQEDAKRSHLFDNIPIVINGGPGTGKTTTTIQRLKFLTSAEALRDAVEFEHCKLRADQIQALTDPASCDSNWIYFSPTHLLLKFLRQNMVEEDLRPSSNNTYTLTDFRGQMLNRYKLIDPEKDGPFKMLKHADKESKILITQPIKVIDDFESFVVKNISNILINTANLPTSKFEWHYIANKIKVKCKGAAKVTNIEALMRIFDSLKDNESKEVATIDYKLKELLKSTSKDILDLLLSDSETPSVIKALFDRWEDEMVSDDTEAVENEMDESEEEDTEDSGEDIGEYKAMLFTILKSLIRNLSLVKYNSKTKITKRQQQVYNIIKPKIENYDFTQIGELAWFVKNFAFLCRGTESNILNQIPRLYKLYRKNLLQSQTKYYYLPLLEKLVNTKENKQIHPDEQNLLIGFINHMLRSINRQSRIRFDSMKKHKYASAFKANLKYVIGIDEATDYSLLDYYFMVSFRHYDFSSITLCGDIMQGLNSNGVNNWHDLDNPNILPGLQEYELSTSYRQTPTLVEMSRKMYLDDQESEAPFNSQYDKEDTEPAPLKYVSNDDDNKLRWIAKRITEINKVYEYDLPSIGIFVADDVDINSFINAIKELDVLGAIPIQNGDTSSLDKCVRVFHLSQVKGMEFEVAFFHNIDSAIAGSDTKLMRRHLYVGISRASSFLAATFNKEEGNEEVLKYFSNTKTNWKI